VELVQAQEERVSNELQLSGMKKPPLNEHDGCSYTACRAAQTAKPQSFALRQPAGWIPAFAGTTAKWIPPQTTPTLDLGTA
jgi:hypothetical protein